MGANLVRRLTKDGHACVVYDVNPDAVKNIQGKGVTAADSMEDLVNKLDAPRAGWGWNRKPAGFFLASTAAFNILGYEHDKNEPVICLWNE